MVSLRRMYRVTLNSRNGSGPIVLDVRANAMNVNHRGDLTFHESTPSYSTDKLVAAFRSGAWVDAQLVAEEQEPTKPGRGRKAKPAVDATLPMLPVQSVLGPVNGGEA